jgi:hypothetical protein
MTSGATRAPRHTCHRHNMAIGGPPSTHSTFVGLRRATIGQVYAGLRAGILSQFVLRRPVVPPYCRSALLPNDYISEIATGGLIVKLEAQGVFAGDRTRPHLRGEVPLPCLAIERGLQMYRLHENWPTAIFDRLGFAKRRHILYRIGYGVDERGRCFVTTRPVRGLAGPAPIRFRSAVFAGQHPSTTA